MTNMGTVLRRTIVGTSMARCAYALNQPALSVGRIGSRSLSSMVTESSRHRAGAGASNSNSRLFLLGGAAVTAGAAYSYENRAQLSAGAEGAENGGFADTALYKQTAPIQTGQIKVSDIHTIAFTVYGNPDGKPVLFVHGGPGGGTDPAMSRFFDPKKYKIVLVDQRGCGKSTPFAELRENTTWDSVEDFEKIRKLLQIEKWQVFGGSWGSTLALAYAQTHPDRTTELVLRGIFMLREKELDWFYQGKGANFIFPEDWARYEAAIPEEERYDYIKAYGKRLRGELGEEEMNKAAKAWSIWEGRTSKLVQDSWDSVKDKFGDDKFSLAFARIENHYFTNKGFFPRDGYLLEKERIDRVRHIPTVIVQGRYDVVCPAITAYDLKKVMPEADITYTTTGHSGFEKEIIANLVAATDRFAK